MLIEASGGHFPNLLLSYLTKCKTGKQQAKSRQGFGCRIATTPSFLFPNIQWNKTTCEFQFESVFRVLQQ